MVFFPLNSWCNSSMTILLTDWALPMCFMHTLHKRYVSVLYISVIKLIPSLYCSIISSIWWKTPEKVSYGWSSARLQYVTYIVIKIYNSFWSWYVWFNPLYKSASSWSSLPAGNEGHVWVVFGMNQHESTWNPAKFGPISTFITCWASI